jgi:hypothetical protein
MQPYAISHGRYWNKKRVIAASIAMPTARIASVLCKRVAQRQPFWWMAQIICE